MARKSYEDRNDLEKCQSQWNKLNGLHSREEWSAAIVRAATAAEIAANFAIRQEFRKQSKLRDQFVDDMLRWANGLSGKIDRLLIPLVKGKKREKRIREIQNLVKMTNDTRNDVVHRGEFRSESESKETIQAAKKFIESLIRIYEPSFELRDKYRG